MYRKTEYTKRSFRAVRHCQISLLASLQSLSIAVHAQTNTLEAENGTLTGISIATSAPGYSGSGNVTGFERGVNTIW
jgi:hypothetical protein